MESVKENISKTNYPEELIKYVKGRVEKPLPKKELKKIAILLLDTDWYESTKHELENLFPLLVKGGVLIVDDYGHWKGSRKAVDEYITKNNLKILLHRVDYTGRIAIKQ